MAGVSQSTASPSAGAPDQSRSAQLLQPDPSPSETGTLPLPRLTPFHLTMALLPCQFTTNPHLCTGPHCRRDINSPIRSAAFLWREFQTPPQQIYCDFSASLSSMESYWRIQWPSPRHFPSNALGATQFSPLFGAGWAVGGYSPSSVLLTFGDSDRADRDYCDFNNHRYWTTGFRHGWLRAARDHYWRTSLDPLEELPCYQGAPQTVGAHSSGLCFVSLIFISHRCVSTSGPAGLLLVPSAVPGRKSVD